MMILSSFVDKQAQMENLFIFTLIDLKRKVKQNIAFLIENR